MVDILFIAVSRCPSPYYVTLPDYVACREHTLSTGIRFSNAVTLIRVSRKACNTSQRNV